MNDSNIYYVMYGGSAGPGKSFLGCFWIWLMCMSFPGVKYFIGRNQLTDARKSVIDTWIKVTSVCNLGGWSFSNDAFKFENGSRARLIDLSYYPKKDPLFERYGSREFTGGWIEEANETVYAAFDTLKSRIGRFKNKSFRIPPKILITCNPKKNWLYKDFYLPALTGTLDKRHGVVLATHVDNPSLDESYIDILNSIKDPQKKARLRDGNWEYDDDPNVLIPYENILNIFSNRHVIKTGQKYLIADVAMRGSDKMVIGAFNGWVLIDIKISEKNDGKEAVQLIEGMKVKHGIPNSRICFDADGVGGYLSGYFRGAVEFINNSVALEIKGKRPNYENLKTQCYYYLSDQINSFELHVDCFLLEKNKDEIIEELEHIKSRDSDKDGKIKLIKKEDVKRDIGRSPDFSDMLAMRSIFDLKPIKKYKPYKLLTV